MSKSRDRWIHYLLSFSWKEKGAENSFLFLLAYWNSSKIDFCAEYLFSLFQVFSSLKGRDGPILFSAYVVLYLPLRSLPPKSRQKWAKILPAPTTQVQKRTTSCFSVTTMWGQDARDRGLWNGKEFSVSRVSPCSLCGFCLCLKTWLETGRICSASLVHV